MGWFSDIVSSTTKFVSENSEPVVRAAKIVASKAIHFMAEEAEAIVGKVKEAWKWVKPYVQMAPEKIRAIVPSAAKVHPYVGALVAAVAMGLDALLAFENSELANKLDEVISEIAQKARDLQQQIRAGKISFLTAEEYEEGIKIRISLRDAWKSVGSISDKDRSKLEIATAINDFGIARADVRSVIEAGPRDYEHYLRLRATQKLLGAAEAKLIENGSIEILMEDDWFLVRIASDLIKPDPELSEQDAKRLDGILSEKHGKTLESFVYEELIAIWEKEAESLEVEIEESAKVLASNTVSLRRLQIARRVQDELEVNEALELDRLEMQVRIQEEELESKASRQRDIQRYANAAEGFLQMLEKSPEQLASEGRDYVLDDGEKVGCIIVKAFQHSIVFSDLSAEDQALVVDFANIFRADARRRMDSILEMAA